MSLTAALKSAQTGLLAQERKSGAASANIANASTPGYVRRETASTSLLRGGFGQGVDVTVLRHKTDDYLLRDVRLASADAAGKTREAEALGRLDTAMGRPEDGRSVAARLGDLETALRDAASEPNNVNGLRNAVSAASRFADELNTVSATIRAERERADAEIAVLVADANDRLGRIAGLNDQIASFQAGGRDASDLRDERDRQIDALSELLPIRVVTRDQGDAVIMTTGGTTLLDGTARPLAFNPLTAIPAGLTYPADSPPLSGLTVGGIDIAPGSGAGGSVGRGALAGLFAVRDRHMPEAQAHLDALAQWTAAAFQEADATVPGGGATSLFVDGAAPATAIDPTVPAPGLAGRLTVNALVDPDQGGSATRLRTGINGGLTPPGDPTQLYAFVDAFDAPRAVDPSLGLGTDRSVRAVATDLVSGIHLSRSTLDSGLETASLTRDTLQNARLDRDGVNLDAQMQTLLEIETAYGANAQVLSTISRLFDELLSIR